MVKGSGGHWSDHNILDNYHIMCSIPYIFRRKHFTSRFGVSTSVETNENFIKTLNRIIINYQYDLVNLVSLIIESDNTLIPYIIYGIT